MLVSLFNAILNTTMEIKDSREHLFENPTPLNLLFIRRRSFRKYQKAEVEPAKIKELELTAELFISANGFRHSCIRITKDIKEFESVVKAATKGFSGKVNPWLNKTNASNIILAIVNTEKTVNNADRLKRIAETAMLMETVILRATELGLATCWMAGINSGEIEKEYRLNLSEEIIAISTLGYPPLSSGITDYDFWANRLVSGRRKDLSQLVFYEDIRE